MENLKVDIVYANAQNDFEMEFNLRGCCGMRLLTDKTDSIKGYIMSLSRAVSRSKIIICCGKLTGDDGIIKITAKAIGKNTEEIDCSEYGLSEENKAIIIEGGVPLIVKNQLFCGCIIESGPQSIILLSNNKIARKEALSTLVHPYIQEISILQMEKQLHPEIENPEKAVAPFADNEVEEVTEVVALQEGEALEEEQEDLQEQMIFEEAKAESAEIPEKIEEKAEEQAEIKETEQENPAEQAEQPVSEEIAEKVETEKEKFEPVIKQEEPLKKEKAKKKKEDEEYATFIFDDEEDDNPVMEPRAARIERESRYAAAYIPSEKDSTFISEKQEEEFDYYIEEEEENEPRNKSNIFTIIIIAVLILLIIAAALYVLLYLPKTQGISTGEFMNKILAEFNK